MNEALGLSVPAWARDDFGVPVSDLQQVVGGLDPEAAVWCARGDDGRLWSVKWTRRDNRFGLMLARALSAADADGVPEQLLAADGVPWSERAGGRLSINRWVEGREAFEAGLSASEWRSLGRLLRRVHEEPPPAFGGDAVREGGKTRRGIRRAGIRIRQRLNEIDFLAERLEGRHLDDDSLVRMQTSWPDIRRRVVALYEAARRLKQTRTPTTRVSCHGDPHLGNVIVDASGQPWLIDFDDAVRAPREVDLMLVELGVLFTLPISASDRQAFSEGYGPVCLDQDRILRFGCIRAIEDLLESVHDLLTQNPARVAADLEILIDGVLSADGLAGLVERRLRRI